MRILTALAFGLCLSTYVNAQDDAALRNYLTTNNLCYNGECDSAMILIEEGLLKEDRFFYALQLNKASCFYQTGRPFSEVDSVLNIVISVKKDNEFYNHCNGTAHWLYSNYYSKQFDLENCEKSLDKSLKYYDRFSPRYSSLLSNLGLVQLRLEKYEKAIATFSKALKHDSSNPYGYNNRALAYIRSGDLENAEKDLKKSLELDDSNSYLYKHYALLYIAQKRNEKACLMLDKAKELGYYEYGGHDKNEVNDLLNKHCK